MCRKVVRTYLKRSRDIFDWNLKILDKLKWNFLKVKFEN